MNKQLKEKKMNKLIGTVIIKIIQAYYIAPEVIKGDYC